MIAIIDYEAGNPHSVENALEYLGYESVLVNRPSDLEQKEMIILPGVGSALATKNSLTKLGIWGALGDYVHTQGIPFLGICVGMQILFEYSEEDNTSCLGWLEGQVKRYDSKQVRVPQMGWNSLTFNPQHTLYSHFHKQGESPYFYFVNSYYVDPTNHQDVLGSTEYGTRFCSMINRDNIFATQFHIEKSSQEGMRLLKKIFDLCDIYPTNSVKQNSI